MKIHFVSKFRPKILIFEEIKAFSIYKGLTMKKWSQIWWCHMKSRKRSEFWKFIFFMPSNKFSHKQQRYKNFLHSFIWNWNCGGHIVPPPPRQIGLRQDRVPGKPGCFIIWSCMYACVRSTLRSLSSHFLQKGVLSFTSQNLMWFQAFSSVTS